MNKSLMLYQAKAQARLMASDIEAMAQRAMVLRGGCKGSSSYKVSAKPYNLSHYGVWISHDIDDLPAGVPQAGWLNKAEHTALLEVIL